MMEFKFLSVPNVSTFVFTVALLTPSTCSIDNGQNLLSQHVIYDKDKIISKNDYKGISYQRKINLTNILPNSEDFTEEEEKIYSEAANAYYGNNYKNKSLHDLYYV